MGLGSYLIYIVIIMAIPLLAQMKVKGAYAKYSKIESQYGYTGYEVARKILDNSGLYQVKVEETPGSLSDHYDPRTRTVRLSTNNYYGKSLAGVQHDRKYAFLSFRHLLFPVANFGSSLSWIFIMIGLFTQATGLFAIGIALLAVGVLFQIVTLPVEFNASTRAMAMLTNYNIITTEEVKPSKKVLQAAALTYVAATLVAVAELVRLVLMFTGFGNSDD
ncbi:MAG: putative peptidase rane zinc metallopeptidase [Bacillales bacterium]|nr:putative peptidase rane zinc metallopeptidase [Bacillales bacterium]